MQLIIKECARLASNLTHLTIFLLRSDGKIDADELSSVFRILGHTAKKTEIEDMIWEVDDDCDMCVNWPEFQTMYNRCRQDKTGYEPRRLFNVVEFLMNDKDDSGTVSIEEAMQILYLRFGKGLLDSHLEDMFGTSDANSTSDLTLTEFLNSLHLSQAKHLRSTAKSHQQKR
mmetsp:Transcript_8821/g.32330  ORF Transcript_8821/g.32330 Transcript_8821/m.32330 type:complete len:172 (-) Transcript_8821:340-855(-)